MWATVEARSDGTSQVRVSVTDTGPGISAEDQTKLFQAFSQVDDSPTRKTGGSGLGLSISQQLIQLQGGRIGVESAPGQGSTFFFTLPVYQPESQATRSATSGSSGIAAPLRKCLKNGNSILRR